MRDYTPITPLSIIPYTKKHPNSSVCAASVSCEECSLLLYCSLMIFDLLEYFRLYLTLHVLT